MENDSHEPNKVIIFQILVRYQIFVAKGPFCPPQPQRPQEHIDYTREAFFLPADLFHILIIDQLSVNNFFLGVLMVCWLLEH